MALFRSNISAREVKVHLAQMLRLHRGSTLQTLYEGHITMDLLLIFSASLTIAVVFFVIDELWAR